MANAHRPLRAALIGYGTAGAVFHAPLITAEPGLRLAAIVTGNPPRQAAARETHRYCAVHPTAEDVWTRSDQFDLAVIAALTRHHASLARKALALGLATVGTRPAVRTSVQASTASRLTTSGISVVGLSGIGWGSGSAPVIVVKDTRMSRVFGPGVWLLGWPVMHVCAWSWGGAARWIDD